MAGNEITLLLGATTGTLLGVGLGTRHLPTKLLKTVALVAMAIGIVIVWSVALVIDGGLLSEWRVSLPLALVTGVIAGIAVAVLVRWRAGRQPRR